MKTLFIFAAFICVSFGVQAQDSNWRLLLGAGFADGGEKFRSGTITTIGTTHVIDFDLQAGSGVQKRLGVEYRLSERARVQASVGHSSMEPMGINGSYDFTVVPVEIMGFVEPFASLRVGVGLRKTNAQLTGTGVVANDPAIGKFEGTQGSVVEVQYFFSNRSGAGPVPNGQFGISLRRVDETLVHRLGTIDGSHVEVGMVVYF